MEAATSFRREWIIAYIALIFIGCAPIWCVDYFVQQDGSAHIYNSYMMGLILRGDPSAAYLALNTLAVPNSTGHWLLAFMLQFVGPFAATKLIATFTFAGMTASAGWLRWKTVGSGGVIPSMLIGATLAFNWMWLAGFYNFSIGVIVFVFTVGLYYSWRGNVTPVRFVVLASFLVLGYWSHIVSFAMLAGTVSLLAVFGETSDRRSTILRTLPAVIPVLALFFWFRSVAAPAGDSLTPHWRSLSSITSPTAWIMQMLSADPFVIISRKLLPFVDQGSPFFQLAAPVLWIAVGTACLIAASLFVSTERSKGRIVFGAIVAMSLLVALFAPDDFGLTNGSIIRERILLCGLFLTVCLIGVSGRLQAIARIGIACFAFAFLYQTAALWDYSLSSNDVAKEFLAAKEHIPDGSTIASVVVARTPSRFSSYPVPQMNAYNGIGRDVRVWDNYEVGHYLFPVVAASAADREFVHELIQVNALSIYNPADLDEKLQRLDRCLELNHQKVNVMVVWDADPKVSAVLSKWFEDVPFYSNERLKLLRHR